MVIKKQMRDNVVLHLFFINDIYKIIRIDLYDIHDRHGISSVRIPFLH